VRPAGLASFYGLSDGHIFGRNERILTLSTVLESLVRALVGLTLPVTIWDSF